MVIVKIHDIPPVTDMVSHRAVRFVVKPLRMILYKPGIRGRVVVYDIHHQLHSAGMNRIRKCLEVFHRSKTGIHFPVVSDRIRGAKTPFAVQFSGRMDRQKIDPVRPEFLDAVQIIHHCFKCSFFIVAHEDLIEDLAAQIP